MNVKEDNKYEDLFADIVDLIQASGVKPEDCEDISDEEYEYGKLEFLQFSDVSMSIFPEVVQQAKEILSYFSNRGKRCCQYAYKNYFVVINSRTNDITIYTKKLDNHEVLENNGISFDNFFESFLTLVQYEFDKTIDGSVKEHKKFRYFSNNMEHVLVLENNPMYGVQFFVSFRKGEI